MAVEFLLPNDNKPPKFRKLPRYQLTPKRKRMFKIMLILTLVLGVINGLSAGNFIHGFMKIVYFMAGIQLIIFLATFHLTVVMTKATNGASLTTLDHIQDYYKKVFIENGYQVDYEAKGLLVDTKNKKLGFTIARGCLDPNTKIITKMLICDYSDVRSWKATHGTVKEMVNSRATTVHNSFTNTSTMYVSPAYERTAVNLYGVQVTINYPDYPLQGFNATSQNDANNWVARLDSLING